MDDCGTAVDNLGIIRAREIGFHQKIGAEAFQTGSIQLHGLLQTGHTQIFDSGLSAGSDDPGTVEKIDFLDDSRAQSGGCLSCLLQCRGQRG